jgi:hypothetical protein
MDHGLNVRETEDYKHFWDVLTANLAARYGIKPVHTLEEIELLASRFPGEIKLYGSYSGDILLAGAVVYLSENVCHVQYNAASKRGKEMGAQDLIMDFLIKNYSKSKQFLDFGISTEKDGQVLNTGLVEYKESFGARAEVQDFYEINLMA